MLTVILSALLACSSGQEEATAQPATETVSAETTPVSTTTTQLTACVDSTNDGVDDCATQSATVTTEVPSVTTTTTETTSTTSAAGSH